MENPMKKLIWMGTSSEDLRTFPRLARREMGYQLENVQEGIDPDDWKPMSTVGSGVREIRVRESSGAFRCIYLATRPEGIYVLHLLPKENAEDKPAGFGLGSKKI
jgi:phage-related protein